MEDEVFVVPKKKYQNFFVLRILHSPLFADDVIGFFCLELISIMSILWITIQLNSSQVLC